MAKNIKKLFAMILVVCMLITALPMQALAADEVTTTETSPEGLTTEVTTTTETTTDESGKTTVTVTIEKATAGTTEDGVNVNRTETKTTETATEADGSSVETTVESGEETKEWSEDIQPGQDVPEVELELKDGETTSNSVSNAEDPNVEISGDPIEGENDQEYDQTTTTTTTEREVTGTLEMEEEFIIDGLDSSLECPVGPEDYEGKQYYDYSDDLCDPNDPKKYDTHYREGLLPGLTVDQLTGVGDKPDGEGYDKGYDLTWTGYGDMTDGATGVFVEELVYLTDENGEIVYENGFPVVDMEKSTFITVGNKMTNDPETGYQGTGMVSSPVQFALQHENGNYFYAYCMDAATGASPTKNKWYSIQNLEDAIESSENPEGYITVDEAAMIRAIATNGYWGTDPNVTNEDGSANRGSIAAMKELLKATYTEDTVINVRYPGSNEAHPYSIYELIDGLTEAEALAVTQAAIWTFANKDDLGSEGSNVIGVLSASKYHNTRPNTTSTSGWLSQYRPAKDGESDARMQALYQALLSLEPIYADGELREDSTVIPDEGVVSDVAIVVKDKAEGEAANEDDNKDNDVYNTDLNFKLAFVPGEKDEMYVVLMDSNNQPIMGEDGQPIKKLLAAEDSTKTGDDVLKPVNGVYTLTGLKLSENSPFEFDLRLEGTQYLNEGVYIYQAEGGRRESQTLVGLAKGEQNITVHNQMTIEFNVDEENHVVAERVWRSEADPIVTPANPVETTDLPDEDPWTPPQIQRLANDGVEIPEEPVPLAAPAVTGDSTGLWIVFFLTIAFSMAAINLFDKKRTV